MRLLEQEKSAMGNGDIDYGRLKALVIDDDTFTRKTVIMILNQIGIKHVKEAADGGSGLDLNYSFLPDLIICDIEMQPIDGIVFLQMLRESGDIKNGDVPVVFLTGHAETRYVESARELGVDGFVVKPPSIQSMKKRIDVALLRSVRRRESKANP